MTSVVFTSLVKFFLREKYGDNDVYYKQQNTQSTSVNSLCIV